MKIIPMNETLLNCSDKGYEALDVQHCNENLQFRYRFTQEEQYVVLLQIQEDGVWTNCCELRVYSVKPDYFNCVRIVEICIAIRAGRMERKDLRL